MKKILQIVAPLGFALATFSSQAQHKCSSHQLLQEQLASDPEFAKQLAALDLESMTNEVLVDGEKKKRQNLTIPVVFHVIHNGVPVGTGANVADSRLLAQLAVLNRDFQKKATDTLKPNHPFYNLMANTEIDFCLAQKSPSGAVSSGINRYNYGMPSFDQATMNGVIKPQTIWDNTKYLNLWVTNLVDATVQGTLLGYAQFPGGPTYSDGVVLLFSTLPTSATSLSQGRTAVHEVGHWLNLRHIWGDDSCGNDQVSDTPPAIEKNFGCPTFPWRPNNGCDTTKLYPNGEMYMNYMDYSDDACMKGFTYGQKSRMQIALTKARGGLMLNAGVCGNGVAINNIDLKNEDLHIFPNPAINEINVRFNKGVSNCKVALLNTTGMVIMEKTEMPKNDLVQLNISDLASGIYFLKVEVDGTTITQKISKQ